MNEIFLILLTQSVGRFVALGIAGPDLTTFMLPAADLCTLCLLEGGKDLAFWKFALVRSSMREQAFITPTGVIDEYEFYRKNRYTYYATDEYRPNAIWIIPGGAGVLRREVFRQRDWHGVQSYEANQIVEVTCFMSPDVPVYAPSERLGSELALLVEGLPMPVWVVGPEKLHHRELRRVYAEFVDAIAYWLWQFAVPISPVLQDIRRKHEMLRVIVELNWASDGPGEVRRVTGATQPPVTAETNQTGVIGPVRRGDQRRHRDGGQRW